MQQCGDRGPLSANRRRRTPDGSTSTTIVTPASQVRRGDDIRLIIGGADPHANRDPRLVDLIVEARLAYQHLLTSTALSLDEVAAEHGHSRKHFSRLLRLATLAPDIVAAILDGRQPAQMSRTALLGAAEVTLGWSEQRVRFGAH